MTTAGAVYCIDSSSLIHASKRAYPPRRFPRLWTAIEDLSEADRLIISLEVYHELERKDHEVFAWAKERKDAQSREIDDDVQDHVIRLMRTYPRLRCAPVSPPGRPSPPVSNLTGGPPL